MRIDHEHNAVHALEHELAGSVIDRLPRHGVELKAGGETRQGLGVERQKIEEERAVRIGGQGDQLALLRVRDLLVERDEIRRLAAKRRRRNRRS